MDGQNDAASNRFFLINSIVKGIAPVNLSKDLSVCLNQVTHYAPEERLDDKEKPTGEFIPTVHLTSGVMLLLTDEQNKVFREVWNLYCQAQGELVATLSIMYQPAEQMTAAETKGELSQ